METAQITSSEPNTLAKLEKTLENIDIWQLANIVANANDPNWEKAALSLLEKKLKNLDNQSLKKFLERQNNREVRAMCVSILTRNGVKATIEIGRIHRAKNFTRKLFGGPSA